MLYEVITHRFDQAIVSGRLECLAQTANMHIDGAFLDEYVIAPDSYNFV